MPPYHAGGLSIIFRSLILSTKFYIMNSFNPREIFDLINNATDREFLLRMSYMEIYNEDIKDLLAPGEQKLQVHESRESGVYVAGLREEIASSPSQVMDLQCMHLSHVPLLLSLQLVH